MGRDRDKWCEFHKMRGHDTDSCWTLKARIDKLIRDESGLRTPESFEQRPMEAKRQCRPDDFLREDSPDQDEAKPSDEIRGTISTIAAGFTGGGVTSSSRRRYSRSVMMINTQMEDQHPHLPEISFSDLDFEGIKPHQDDPMVIEARISNFMVKRILVDQGSSTDILYWEAFQRLGLSHDLLLPFSGSLIGFAGESVEVRGYVNLLTSFGESPSSVPNQWKN
ncbi:hypothetical protein SESBI_03100 [Sesbania bispinosa]|nr:hypothetical protein SESBI_03100 [Sesbania bispinosa]